MHCFGNQSTTIINISLHIESASKKGFLHKKMQGNVNIDTSK
jgi:hypothetical protein